MKIHTTNYNNTLIAVADDCPCSAGTIPPLKKETLTMAGIQYQMLVEHPYEFTSDEILFQLHASKHQVPKQEYQQAFAQFFSKGQACFRASPLTKRYGWGVHFNEVGKMALVGMETENYQQLLHDETLQVVKAMRSSKASS
ncbi:MAG TPA: DUF6157 family protein [Chitinophagaceae bacterium]|nr:DUF6157 family protein [Chitinophagaceae bacterium]